MAEMLRTEEGVNAEAVSGRFGELSVSVDDLRVYSASPIWYPRTETVITQVRRRSVKRNDSWVELRMARSKADDMIGGRSCEFAILESQNRSEQNSTGAVTMAKSQDRPRPASALFIRATVGRYRNSNNPMSKWSW